MRAHTALHLLTVVLPYPVTGGSVGDGEGRLDFDSGETALERGDIERRLNALIARDAEILTRWISDEELAANPGLVKTMSVKPPTGTGRVRWSRSSASICSPAAAPMSRGREKSAAPMVTGIEKKGRINRRVRIALADKALSVAPPL